MEFEKSVQDNLLKIYKKAIKENESPNNIKLLIKSQGLANISISAIKENIKYQLSQEWDKNTKKWIKSQQISIFNDNEEEVNEIEQETIPEQVIEKVPEIEIEESIEVEVVKSPEADIEKTMEVQSSANSIKSYIYNKIINAKLERLSELTLELALDKECEKIENEDMQIIINNMETILKYMNKLQEKMKQISKNFNKLTDCLAEVHENNNM